MWGIGVGRIFWNYFLIDKQAEKHCYLYFIIEHFRHSQKLNPHILFTQLWHLPFLEQSCPSLPLSSSPFLPSLLTHIATPIRLFWNNLTHISSVNNQIHISSVNRNFLFKNITTKPLSYSKYRSLI